MHSALPTPTRQAPREDHVGREYRSLSGLAVGGFLLGLASPACLAAAPLMVVPILAVAVALAAARRVATNAEVLTGRPLALAGAFLAVASVAAAATRDELTRRLLARQSAPVADAWIERVRGGDFEGAYALSLDAARGQAGPKRAPPGAKADSAPPEAARRDAVADYAKLYAVQALASLGPEAEVRPRSAAAVRRGRNGSISLTWFYRVTVPGRPAGDLVLSMRRRRPVGGAAGLWRVGEASLVPTR